jgi:polysaccharide chain length determinant protein (PEP-CTERM system associated)
MKGGDMEQVVTQLISILKGVWKYRWYATAVAWAVAIVGGIIVYLLPSTYQASAKVYVDTQNILKPLLSSMTSMPNMEQQVAIMGRTLLNRPNVEKLIRMVDLDISAKTVKAHEKLVEELSTQITIGAPGRDDVYMITYINKNPKIAKDVVQSLLTIFVETSYGDKKQDSTKAITFIDEQIKTYEAKLVAAENNLKEFKLKNAEILPSQGSVHGSKVLETAETLNKAKLELTEAEQARDAIKKQISGEQPVLLEGAATFDNPEIDGRIRALQKNLDFLQQHYTDQHPDIVSNKRLIAQLEARKLEEAKLKRQNSDPGKNYSPMLQEMNIAWSEAEATVAAMKARVNEYSARHKKAKAMSNAVPEVEARLAQLNRDYLINKENYEKLVGRREAAKLSGEMTATTDMIKFRIVDPPVVPLTPAGPNRLRLLSFVFIGALMSGLGIALLLSQLRPTFLNQHSLREATGLPVLGTVSMNWTENELIRRKRSLYTFGFSVVSLLIMFGGLFTTMMLRT